MNPLNIEKKEELVRLFEATPTRNQTLEMCEAAVEHNGLNIKRVSKRLMSKELCVKAIQNDTDAFFELSKDYICKETLVEVYKSAKKFKKGYHYNYEIEKKINRMKGIELSMFLVEDLAKAMVLFAGRLIEKSELRPFRYDLEILVLALETYGDGIKYIPTEVQTKEHVLKAIQGGVRLEYISHVFLEDDEILDALVMKDKQYFSQLPEDKKTYHRCLLAVKHGLELKDIPKEHYTQEVAHAAVEFHSGNLGNIPTEFVTKELMLKAAEDSTLGFLFLKPHVMDEEFAYELLQKGIPFRYACIRENQSQRMVDFALQQNIGNILNVRAEFLTDKIVDEILEEDAELIRGIPQEFVNEERVYSAVCKGVGLDNKVVKNNQSQRIIDELLKRNYFEEVKGRPRLAIQRIELVDEEFKTKEFFKEVLKTNSDALSIVPSEFIDEELCYIVACAGASVYNQHLLKFQSQRIVDALWESSEYRPLRFVKDEFKTDDVIKKSIESDTENILYVPEDKMKEEYVYLYVSKGGMLYNHKLAKFQSKRIVEKAFELRKENFAYFKDEFKTKEMSEEAFNYDKGLVRYIPEAFATTEMWIDAIRERKYLHKTFIASIPKKFCTDEVFIEIIKCDWRLLEDIPKEFLTLELQMVAFEIEPRSLVYFDI